MKQVFLLLALFFQGSLSFSDSLQKRYTRALEWESRGKFVHALKEYREILKFRPQSTEISNRAASCFERLGYLKLALRYYEKSLEYAPQNAKALEGKTRVSLALASMVREEEQENQGIEIVLPGQETKAPAVEETQSRLWFSREGVLYTMLRNGSSQRRYSEVQFGWLDRPVPGFGWLSTMGGAGSGQKDRDIQWFDGRTGTLYQVLSSSKDDYNPVYLSGSHFHFLRSESSGGQWLEAELSSEGRILSETRVMDDFQDARGLIPGPEGLWVLGRRNSIEPIKAWYFHQGELLRKSPGSGEDDGVVPSSQASLYAIRRVDPALKRNFLILNETNGKRLSLPQEGVDLLEGSFDPKGNFFFAAASVKDSTEGWATRLMALNLTNSEQRVLLKTNFLIRNLVVDEGLNWVYYLTDYDGNFEVYRLAIQGDGIPERLTLSSDQNELQLGVWTFPSF